MPFQNYCPPTGTGEDIRWAVYELKCMIKKEQRDRGTFPQGEIW